MPLLGELIVRPARHDVHLELWQRLIVDDPAQRARREDVGLGSIDRVGLDRLRPEVDDYALDLGGVDIARDQLRPFLI